MKLFLKIVLILIVAAVALKLLPWALAVGVILAGALGVAAFMGVSLLAMLVCALLGLAVILSPIWLLALAIVGLVALVRRVRTS